MVSYDSVCSAMGSIGKLWAGKAFGTNVGNLFLEIETKTNGLVGILRFADDKFGLSVYDVSGTFDNGRLALDGKLQQHQLLQGAITLSIQGDLMPTGSLRGRWAASTGAAGTFELFPHDIPRQEASAPANAQVPEQLHTRRSNFGAVRLYPHDVRALAAAIQQDFANTRVVVTYKRDDIENSRYYEDFEAEGPNLGVLRYVRFNVQMPEAHGLNKAAMVELNALGQNQIVVQGIYEAWVMGKVEMLSRHLAHYEKRIVTGYRKWGVTVNQLVFIATLLLAPEIHPIWKRILFATIVLLLVGVLWQLHRRYVPTAVIYMSPRQPGFLERSWPSVLSWVMSVAAAVLAAFVFYWLRGTPPP